MPFVWTDQNVAQLRKLLAQGVSVSKAGFALGISKGAVKSKMRRLGIHVSAADAKAKQDVWRRDRANTISEKKRLSSNGISKTSPEYRRRLPLSPLMSKQQMRDQLRQAVLNTGGRLA